MYDEIEFISRYRVTRDVFIQLEEKVLTFLHRSTFRSYAIPAATQLAVSLQFLATGSFQTVVASSHGISQPSVSRCIRTVTDALCFYAKEFIVFPSESEQLLNQQRFTERHFFPKVLGCIDGTHVPILAPPNNKDIFVNRKTFTLSIFKRYVIVDGNSSTSSPSGQEALTMHSYGGSLV